MTHLKTLTMRAAVAIFAAFALVGCITADQGLKQTLGAGLGGVAGGVLGSTIGSGSGAIAATIAGTMAGMFFGSEVGASLDRADQLYAARTQQIALETRPNGAASRWRNPETGNSGEITPTHTYRSPEGSHCRDYRHTVTVEGRNEHLHGTACRTPDGTWRAKR